MKATSRIEVDFQYPETPTKDVLFGAWGVPGSDATPGLRMAFWNNGGKYCFILDSDAYYNHTSQVALDDARHTAVIDAPNRAFRLYAGDGTLEWSGASTVDAMSQERRVGRSSYSAARRMRRGRATSTQG